jgi:hypothetical protein
MRTMNASSSPSNNAPGEFDHRRYVPILLTRQGERLALRELLPAARSGLTPLFVVHPVPKDPATNIAKTSVEEHLRKLAGQLPNDWGVLPAFVDLRWVDTSAPMSNGSHAIRSFLLLCRSKGLHLSPAISTTHDVNYRSAAVAAANEISSELMLRLGPAEWHDLGTPAGDGRLSSLIAETGRPTSELHLLLDLEDQVTSPPAIAATAMRSALRSIPAPYEWASITATGTGMPVGTQALGKNSSAELPRTEWHLWQALSDPTYRFPSFGDYGVQHPNPLSDFNPLFMDSSAQLRYTTAASWFVVRGEGVKKVGNDQIRRLAAQVTSHPEFSGAGFSWGDDWLIECVAQNCSAGSQSVWRKVTTNHHLTYVREQIATLYGR